MELKEDKNGESELLAVNDIQRCFNIYSVLIDKAVAPQFVLTAPKRTKATRDTNLWSSLYPSVTKLSLNLVKSQSKMTKYDDLTRCLLAAGGAPSAEGEGMSLVYEDDSELIVKEWTGSEFEEQTKITSGVKKNTDAPYIQVGDKVSKHNGNLSTECLPDYACTAFGLLH